MRRRRAVGWAYGLTWGRQAIQVTATFTLAAIVGPVEFGVMALALIYIGFIELILQQGFASAIIQRKILRQVHVTSVFWLMTTFSVMLAGLGVILSRYWVAVNEAPELASILPILSLSIPLVALGMVPTALLTRHFRIRALAVRSLTAATVSAGVAIPLALAGFGVWSLVAMHLSYTATSTLLVLTAARWRPSLAFSRAAALELLPFSFASFAQRAGNYTASQVDAIVIGGFLGPAALGVYRLATRCVTLALEFLTGPLQFVSFPELSKLQGDPDRFREGFLAYLRFASLLTWPVLGVVAIAGPYVPLLIGHKWSGVEYALLPLALCGALETLTQFLGPVLKAAGRPWTAAAIVWAQCVLGALAYALVGRYLLEASVAVQTASIGFTKFMLYTGFAMPALILGSKAILKLPPTRLLTATVQPAVWACCVFGVALAVRGAARSLGWTAVSQSVLVLGTGGLMTACGVLVCSAAARAVSVGILKRYSPSLASRFG